MTSLRLFFFLLILLISFSTQAQLYKWVDPNGKVTYSDTPPPKAITHVETKSISSAAKNVTLPYELAQAVKNMPVTLYSADKNSACTDARNFLKKNGIPFSEKTISTNEDIAKLEQISGGSQIPVLFIGKNKLLGFSSSDWRANLTRAGYPESNLLPANYHFSEPQPLVPLVPLVPAVIAPSKTNMQNNTKPGQPEPAAQDPNGFHF